MYGCHSILECYNLFSEVEYKIVLFYFSGQGYNAKAVYTDK